MQADGNGFMVHILSKHQIYRNCLENKKKKIIKLSFGTCAKQRITIENNTNLLFPLLQVVIAMVGGLSLFLKPLTPDHSYDIHIECQHMFPSG